MSYQMNQKYTFKFSRIAFWEGERWIVLKDAQTGKEKMEGYEDMPWVFRVKAMPFQCDWENGEEWPEYTCLVKGYMIDRGCGDATTFPVLVQDINFVNEKLYGQADPESALYFTVAAQPGDPARNGGQIDTWHFKDSDTGWTYPGFQAGDYPQELKVGDKVTVHPVRDAKGQLRFVSPRKLSVQSGGAARERTMPKLFPQGEEAECRVESVDDSYFVLLSNPKTTGQLRIPKPQNGKMPTVGETVCVQCIGYTPKWWPMFAWTGDYAQSGIAVDSLPCLELPQEGETQYVEYKSSLVYPPRPDAEADVGEQLGKNIMRTIAGFMNTKGGSVFVGVRDDGTVRGIEEEGELLNKDNDSGTPYPATQDGIRRKIIDTVQNKLGDYAASLVDVQFMRGPNSLHLVCKIGVARNTTDLPVYLGGDNLWVRCAGETRQMRGVEAARFILSRVRDLEKARHPKSGQTASEVVQAAAKKAAELVSQTLVASSVPDGAPLVLADNQSVSLDERNLDALSSPRGLVFEGQLLDSAKSWKELFGTLLKFLATRDGEKFAALPDVSEVVLKGGRKVFVRKGNRTHLKDARPYVGAGNIIRADLDVGKKSAFKQGGIALRLMEYFGLAPEQFRIWTGSGAKV